MRIIVISKLTSFSIFCDPLFMTILVVPGTIPELPLQGLELPDDSIRDDRVGGADQIDEGVWIVEGGVLAIQRLLSSHRAPDDQ